MHGPQARNIRQRGTEYDVLNASDANADRTVPSYSKTATLIGVLDRRTQPEVVELSSGEEVETTLQLRAVPDSSVTLVESGNDDYPTKLDHPDGLTYRLLVKYPEDSGVTVLSLERE
jgi:hypothetical protein